MRLSAIAIFHRAPTETVEPDSVQIMESAFNLAAVPFWDKKKVEELILQGFRICGARIPPGTIHSVRYPEAQHTFHIVLQASGKGCVVATDAEYPSRSAVSIAYKFLNRVPGQPVSAATATTPAVQNLHDAITVYQDPVQADKISLLQRELEEVHRVMEENIERVLRRGEQIDDLIARSNKLSDASKAFYQRTKKMNSCCTLL
ncbi:putative Synaptobrevin YKT6 [Paratrimastix pyriformis]|uniref:Synaptobrevin YKT6 n=1 Tax=Paratrimastix pyriformis TaxID=342808 RepID=A0ABQ8UPQ5_9EUKA|nr:putative Synaptobrevin YKT6 [Paratrimastix pyriformis]|eukprot:GAFH01004433.1.p1 GENE.GAFH01004433.1~~GAFH01004433.1.p1  ORF type:complete len:203 (+),score=6.77 GAFH01004433.1:46-654(+)